MTAPSDIEIRTAPISWRRVGAIILRHLYVLRRS